MLKLAVLGITGSVGSSVLEVVSINRENIKLVAVSAWKNSKKIDSIVAKYKPEKVVLEKTNNKLIASYPKTKFTFGDKAILELVKKTNYDLLIICSSGISGLLPLCEALKLGKVVALANKEPIVIAGKLINELLIKHHGRIIPLDSEHNAIYQAIRAKNNFDSVKSILLSGSGGPFWDKPKNQFSKITVKQALAHPNWQMGKKISLDSATMMNKALEVIEAHFLFNIKPENIGVVIDRSSKLHGVVNFNSGSSLAVLGNTAMNLPIVYAFAEFIPVKSPTAPINIESGLNLNLQAHGNKFITLDYAYRVLKLGGGAPAFLNGANQRLAELFLAEKISFIDLMKFLGKTVARLNKYFSKKIKAAPYIFNQKNLTDALFANNEGASFIDSLIKENLKQ